MKGLFNRKQKLVKGTSSAVLLSILIHVGLFVLAGLLVVFTVIIVPEPEFEAPKAVERPKMKLKKPKVKVKKSSKPKSTARIVTKSKGTAMPDIQLPEMSGLGDGITLDVGGFDGMMPDLSESTLFGEKGTIGNDFEGTFYDFNRKRDGSNATMSREECVRLLAKFVKSGWRTSLFSKYYRPKDKLYATTFAIPMVQSGMAPLAFGEPETAAYCFAAHYTGKLVYKDDITFRFWAGGDDVLVVRVDGEIVVSAPYPRKLDDKNDTSMVGNEWRTSSPKSRMYWLGVHMSVVGDWITLKAGEPLDMEVLIAEVPGGLFQAMLCVEVEGETYPKNPERGGPILPIFKTVEPSIDLKENIEADLHAGDAQIMGGPIFCDYDTTPKTNAVIPEVDDPADEVVFLDTTPEIRMWTNSPDHILEAKLLTRMNDYVVVRTAQDEQQKLPLEQLSPEDRSYVDMTMPPDFNINFTKNMDNVPVPQLSPYESRQRPLQLTDMTFKTTVKQRSPGTYNHELKVEYYALGDEVDGNNFVLLDRQESSFIPTSENKKSHTVSSEKPVRLMVTAYRNSSPMRGTKYGGYLVTVTDEQGAIIQYKTSHEWVIGVLKNLRKVPVGKHFDKTGNRVSPPRPTRDDRRPDLHIYQ